VAVHLEQIKEAADIVTLINEDTRLVKEGREWAGHHLKHGSQSKVSLKVNPEKGIYYCFNCGEGGDVINWLMNNRGMTFKEAVEELSLRTGIPVPSMSEEDRKYQEKIHQDRQLILPIFKATADFYHAQMRKKHYEEAVQRWGITQETIERFKIGFAPVGGDALRDHLRSFNYKDYQLLKTGLFVKLNGGVKDFFQGRLIFPYWFNNQVVYFIGRKTEDTARYRWEDAKYKKLQTHQEYISPIVKNGWFYGEDTAYGAEELLITEGVADCLAALQVGTNCVSPVTTRFREEDYPKILKLAQKAKTVYIANDSEESNAGEKGAFKTAQYLEQNGVDVRMITLPRPANIGKVDLAEYLRDNTAGKLKQLMAQAKPPVNILVDRLEVQPSSGLSIKKAKEFVTKELVRYEPIIARNIIKKELKNKFNLDAETVKDLMVEYNKHKNCNSDFQSSANEIDERKDLSLKIEQILDSDLRKEQKIKRATQLVMEELNKTGLFFRALMGSTYSTYWFRKEDNRLMPLDGQDFSSYLAVLAGLAPKNEYHKLITSYLDAHTKEKGEDKIIHQLSHYDPKEGKLYLDCFDGNVVVLDGSESWSIIPNGKNGALFIHPYHWQPWTPVDEVTSQDIEDFNRLVLDVRVSVDESLLTPDYAQIITKTWLGSLFFRSIQPTRPHLLLKGEKGSGKSTRARLILRWLFGNSSDVSIIRRDGERDFITTVTNNCLVCFDNVDSSIPWLQDLLATLSTGGSIPMRLLYSTNQEVRYPADCFVILTSRTPAFRRDDISQRLLVLKLTEIKEYTPEGKMLTEILHKRDRLWTVWLHHLNKLVNTVNQGLYSGQVNFRMADFARFLMTAMQLEPGSPCAGKDILRRLEQLQNEFLVTDDPLVSLLLEWLEASRNRYGMRFTPTQLYQYLADLARDRRMQMPISNSKWLSRRLIEVSEAIKQQEGIEITIDKGSGGTRYITFTKRLAA